MSKWQPIETAPQNYDEVLLYCGAGHMCVGEILEGVGIYTNGDFPVFPTHWMPLPEPPEVSDEA